MNRKNQLPKRLLPTSTTRSVAIKAYEEQLQNGFDGTLSAVRSLDPNIYEAYAMIHDKSQKAHLHICVRLVNGKTTKVSTILKRLGINYGDADKTLMDKRGLESVGNFIGYSLYLTHKDSASLRKRKDKYEISDFVTNMGHARFSEYLQGKMPKRNLTKDEQRRQDCRDAMNAGYDLWKYEAWMRAKKIDFVGYKKDRLDEIKMFFKEGLEKRVNELGEVPRLIMEINLCKTGVMNIDELEKIVKDTLLDMGVALDCDQDKSVFNSAIIKKHTEDKEPTYYSFEKWSRCYMKKELYAWVGNYEISLYDNSFTEDIEKVENKAFYYGVINENKEFVLKDVCKSGSIEMQEARKNLYKNFYSKFSIRLKNYNKQNKVKPHETIDYSDILG